MSGRGKGICAAAKTLGVGGESELSETESPGDGEVDSSDQRQCWTRWNGKACNVGWGEERAVVVGGGMQARPDKEWGDERNQGVLGDETWMTETVQQRLML